MSEIKVNSIKGVGASTAAITVNNTDGTCTANLSNRQNRNLIINGAFQVAQRGTSSNSTGYQTVDRISHFYGGTDENPTFAQADVASGTTPYSLGFRKSFKITNGNQTGGAGADKYIHYVYKIEAQDIANSGWNYTSSSSFITLSFWVKASVAQNYYGYLITNDGSTRSFAFETGSLSADTWTKVTVVIPGNSNLTFNNDNGMGLEIDFSVYRGTNFTGSAGIVGSWVSFTSTQRTPDWTSTWYTTNDATFEITGVQLEVGSVATDFEHRSFAQELELCRRYFQQISPSTDGVIALGNSWSSTLNKFVIYFNPNMRASPTVSVNGTVKIRNASGSTQAHSGASITLEEATTSVAQCRATNPLGGLSGGSVGQVRLVDGTTNDLQFSAEL